MTNERIEERARADKAIERAIKEKEAMIKEVNNRDDRKEFEIKVGSGIVRKVANKPKKTKKKAKKRDYSAASKKGAITKAKNKKRQANKKRFYKILALIAITAFTALMIYLVKESLSKEPVIIETKEVIIQEVEIEKETVSDQEQEENSIELPDGYEVYKTVTVESSAYTLAVNETDADPCTPANPRVNLCDGSMDDVCVVASDYAFGTKMLINGKLCESHDRMNIRYRGNYTHIDILTDTKAEAFAWGRKNIEVTVLKSI